MPYNFTISRVASEAREALPDEVTNAKHTSPENEHSQIELAGQAIHTALIGIDDDSLVEIQAHGSDTPSQNARTFHIAMTARSISKSNHVKKAKIKPWTPDQGPLALRTPTEDDSTKG